MEYADYGTLRDLLDSAALLALPLGQLNYRAVLDTCADVAKGMLHLHSLNVVHSDLKVGVEGS
jgi:serine/threonine protein kinase